MTTNATEPTDSNAVSSYYNGWSYDYFCQFVQAVTRSSSSPLLVGDINPTIRKLLDSVPDSYIYSPGGHSVVLSVSSRLMAKVSLRSGCRHLQHEQEVLKHLNQTLCPHVIQTFLCRPDIIFMEPLRNGTLYDQLAKGSRPASAFLWIVRITEAVAFLEAHGYAHGDLNPRNILFNDQIEPVLADFDHALLIGQAVDVGDEPYVRNDFSADSIGQYGTAGAITEQFALGSLFWLIVTGKELYAEIEAHERVDRLIEGRFPDTAALGPMGGIIDSCWHGRYDTIGQLLQYVRTAMVHDDVYHQRRQEAQTICRDLTDAEQIVDTA